MVYLTDYIALNYWMVNHPGLNSGKEKVCFSTPNVQKCFGPTQPFIQWVLGLQQNRRSIKMASYITEMPMLKINGFILHSPILIHVMHMDKFTCTQFVHHFFYK